MNLYILVQYKTIVEIIIHFVLWKPLIMVKILMAWINTEVVSKYVLVCYIYSTSDSLYLIYNKGAWLLIESVRTRSITTPLYCKSDTDCHECCKWFVEWSNENCACWKSSGKFWAHGFEFHMQHNLKSNLKCRTSTFWSSHKKKRWNLSLKSRG